MVFACEVRLRILLLSQYFWPEPFIINNLVLKLTEQGHSVTVFTGKPNYPDGELYHGYKSLGIMEETYHGVPIYRIPIKPRKNGGAKNLILNYFSFVFSGLFHAISFSRKKKFDAILVYGLSPITSVIPGILLKWLTKSHLAVWVQDLWPESISATGFIQNRYILKAVELLVRSIYRFSDTLLVQSHAFIGPVSKLTKSNNKIIYYPNSSEDLSNNITNLSEFDTNISTLLETNFCIVFAGNIGNAQSIETILSAAEKLQKLPSLKVVFVGSGSKTDWLKEQVKLKKLDNVVLVGRLQPKYMPYIYSLAAGLLVTLKKDEFLKYTIPSKIQGYMAAGKPIIASLDGEAARVIQEAGAGLVSPAENSMALAETIERLYHMPQTLRDEMGNAARLYFLQHYEISQQSAKLVEILEGQIKNGSKSI